MVSLCDRVVQAVGRALVEMLACDVDDPDLAPLVAAIAWLRERQVG